MTDCKLTGTQVNGIKFNIKYGQGTLQGLWLVETIWFVEIQGWLSKTKRNSNIDCQNHVVLNVFCSRQFDTACMTGWTGWHKSAGIWQGLNFCKCSSNHPLYSVKFSLNSTPADVSRSKSLSTEGATDGNLVQEKVLVFKKMP